MGFNYDVIVIGGGHNGAVASIVLSLHGLRVLLVDQNYSLGGLAGARTIAGASSSRFAYVIGLVPRELDEWLKILPEMYYPEPNWVELGENDEIVFRWWSDETRLVSEFKEHGIDIAGLFRDLRRFWKCYKEHGLYYTPVAPSQEEAAQILDKCGASYLVSKTAREILSDYMPRRYWDYFIYPSMLDASGFVLAYYMQNNNVWGQPRHSMLSFSRILRQRLRESGTSMLLGARVEEFLFEEGAVRGVKITDGTMIYGRVVLFAAPITSLLDIKGYERLEEWEIRSIGDAKNSTTLRSRVRRIDYVFSEKPSPPREPGWRGTPVYVKWSNSYGGEYTYIEPMRDTYLVQFSGFAKDVFEVLPPGSNEKALKTYDVRDARNQVVCCRNYTGHPDHLPMIDKYLFDKRPIPGWNDYRTSIPCLYHGSASSYPGGEINGVAGLNAAIRILLDFGIKPRLPGLVVRVVHENGSRSKWGVYC